MPDPSDDLTRRLQAEADRLDAAAPPIAAGAARSTSPAASTNRRWLPAAAAVVVLVGIGAAWLLATGDDDPEQLIVPADPPTTTTTPTAPPPLVLDVPMGIAVTSVDGPVRLFDIDGTELGTLAPPSGEIDGPEVLLTDPPSPVEPIDPAEVPEGCASAFGGGGVRVALCNGDVAGPNSIEVIDSAGGSRRLAGPPFDDTTLLDGPFAEATWALPSPDGRWVLAQWSNQCGGMTAFLTPTDGSGVPLDLDPVPPWQSSLGLGWTQDGRAVLQLGHSACGGREGEPGVYVLDPDSRELVRIIELDTTSVRAYTWRNAPGAYTPVARSIDRARQELDLDSVAGGPRGDMAVMSFEGHQIGVNGTAGAAPDGTVIQTMQLLHGEATIATPEADGPTNGPGAFVSFTCGGISWWLDWYDEGTPEVDSMLLLAEMLVPHLYCTLPPR